MRGAVIKRIPLLEAEEWAFHQKHTGRSPEADHQLQARRSFKDVARYLQCMYLDTRVHAAVQLNSHITIRPLPFYSLSSRIFVGGETTINTDCNCTCLAWVARKRVQSSRKRKAAYVR